MTFRENRFAAAALLMLVAGCDAAPPATVPAGPQPQNLPTIDLVINGETFKLQVADDDAEREIGLMHVKSMPADRGMIFVFPAERPLSFWMKNTPIDLDIIYIDHDGKVVSTKTMFAYDTSNVPSDGPATFAIELNAGVAARLKITPGQKIALPASFLANAR